MARKVLLADDSITIQKVVELILTEHGFEVKTVNNGQEAVTTMLSYTPDIVLADAEMPLLNGYQLCERIKNNSRTKDIPVILLAGAFEPIDNELAKSVKADGILTKPFEPQELLNKINSLLTKKEEKLEEKKETEVTAEPALEELWEIEESAIEEIVEPVELVSIEEQGVSVESGVQMEGPSITEISEPLVSERAQVGGISSEAIKEAVIEAVREVIATSDIPSIIRAAVKDSVEKMLAERLPALIEELTKELLKGSLSGISKEIERVLWETLPDLAETLITKEIERIKISLS